MPATPEMEAPSEDNAQKDKRQAQPRDSRGLRRHNNQTESRDDWRSNGRASPHLTTPRPDDAGH